MYVYFRFTDLHLKYIKFSVKLKSSSFLASSTKFNNKRNNLDSFALCTGIKINVDITSQIHVTVK